MHCAIKKNGYRDRPGFTLVEILIVVVVLGILAAIAVPQFTNASHSANESSLKDDLRYLRTQVAVYQSQHHDVAPGFPRGNTGSTPTAQAFSDQLTQFSDEYGNVSPSSSSAYPLGPYLPNIPKNPVNNLNTVEIIGPNLTPTPDDSTGWLYQPTTGTLLPNLSGSDSESKAYAGY
jgi:general secretion pathway protein G